MKILDVFERIDPFDWVNRYKIGRHHYIQILQFFFNQYTHAS